MSDSVQRTSRQTIRRAAFVAVPLVAAGALLAPTLASAATTTTTQLTGCLVAKNGTLVKVKKGTAPKSKCSTGTTKVTWSVKGPKGATGARGPAGPAGPAGASGMSGIVGYQIVESTTGGILGANTVSCPGLKKAIGGGVKPGLLSPLTGALGSFPAVGGTGWTTVTSQLPILGDTFYAVCASVVP